MKTAPCGPPAASVGSLHRLRTRGMQPRPSWAAAGCRRDMHYVHGSPAGPMARARSPCRAWYCCNPPAGPGRLQGHAVPAPALAPHHPSRPEVSQPGASGGRAGSELALLLAGLGSRAGSRRCSPYRHLPAGGAPSDRLPAVGGYVLNPYTHIHTHTHARPPLLTAGGHALAGQGVGCAPSQAAALPASCFAVSAVSYLLNRLESARAYSIPHGAAPSDPRFPPVLPSLLLLSCADFNLSKLMEDNVVMSSMAATNPRWLVRRCLAAPAGEKWRIGGCRLGLAACGHRCTSHPRPRRTSTPLAAGPRARPSP